ncbi:TATA element modulatory factor isoform X2 [Nasonia vitripennis]|uniref:TATA element modulatory factor 1 TATA binding domain-containing protein n=1 Tax=Nasonia vitripennis TaxID=7425 RepID=A0A7M7H7V3_NASVI|nr:TATA element modulatory factor isoform X2 [Nasonia vitripennis]
MSWFDTSGFASLAKTALKEAQKTIDKALDIKDEDQKQPTAQLASSSSDFFDSWGVQGEEDNQDKESSTSQKQQSTSIWGSFTGSFFENPKDDMTAIAVKRAESYKDSADNIDKFQSSLVSSKSLPESLSERTGSKNLLDSAIVQSTTDPDFTTITSSKSGSSEEFISEASTSENVSGKQSSLSKSQDPSSKTDDTNTSAKSSEDTRPSIVEASEAKKSSVVSRKKEQATTHSLNRLSVLSAESDKKSSESVEVLGSQSGTSTDCTNSPDSDVNSLSASVGPKVNSESVEVLPDSSVTSPSSVEVLGDWKSDESPYMSPMDEKLFETSITPTPGDVMDSSFFNESSIDGEDIKSSTSTLEGSQQAGSSIASRSTYLGISRTSKELCASSTSLTSPESVEVLTGEADDVDEVSLADDSYTSASESTLLTIMESLHQQQQQQEKQMHDSCPDSRQTMSGSAGSDYPLNVSLDSLKEKSSLAGLHLPIEAITKQPIRKSDAGKQELDNPFDRIKSSTIEPAPEPPIAKKSEDNLDKSGGSEQYLLLTDSSCEETLVESSSEDNANVSAEIVKQQEQQQPLTASSYVKNMLADAMSEKTELTEIERHCAEVLPRENSPISSESRSDLVKIGSDQTSGHTSGDELETTTSSDIEIISSPNGDSSSTQSRQSPAKLLLCKSSDLLTKTLKTRGHSRELSEISIGSDDANLEIERLLRRIREMTEILEARESKLIEVSRINMELHEQNSSLKKQLDNVEKHAEHSQDLTQITEEYTQRLSALERKFQQAIRERDALRKSLEQMRQEAATRLSSAEISNINAEKDEIIKELREEGEKLSKQQLQHSNIIKKLRAKEKENDALIKSQKEQLEEQTTELERLKRSLYAKEEVERSQIEAVHTLTAKCKKQEKEILSLTEQLDHVTNKMEAYKKSFDAAKSELLETKEKLTDAEEELKLAIENAGESHQLTAQVEDLKVKLRQAEESHIKKEKTLKQENMDLLKRLEAAESRSEEMSESVSQATKPLLRQLEQVQSSLSHKTSLYMRQEEMMTEKIADLQAKLESISEMNRSLGEENTNLKSRCSVLEMKINAKTADHKKLDETLESLKEQNKNLAEENEVHKQAMKMLEEAHATEIKELKREISSLESKISMEKAAAEAEKRKNNAALEQQTVDEELRYSPTLSIERDSVSSANSIWPAFNDAMFESGSGRFPNVYDSFRSGTNSTSMFENLQAQLKQREGEVQQLQWELSRRNAERDALNTEVSSLASKVEDLNSTVGQMETIKESLNDIQTKYDALLQMYGEKVEENQELRLDLEDVKEMYKTQIDQLLKRDL